MNVKERPASPKQQVKQQWKSDDAQATLLANPIKVAVSHEVGEDLFVAKIVRTIVPDETSLSVPETMQQG